VNGFLFRSVFGNSAGAREKIDSGNERSFGFHFRSYVGSGCGLRRTVIEKYYNHGVARGWESKSVEGQQAEASEKPAPGRPRLSAEEAAHWRERENLRLSRQQVLQQLEASQNPRHRQLLEEALADLDEKLGKADGGP
jgi:hypothetical protein